MDEIVNEIIEKKYSQLISDGFKLYAHNLLKLVLIWFLFTSLSILIDVFIISFLTRRYFSNIAIYFSVSLIGSVIFSIISVITMCSVSNYLFEDYLQKDPNFNESFKNAFNERIKYPMILFIIVDLIGSFISLLVFDIMLIHMAIRFTLFLYILINILFTVIAIIITIIATYYFFSIFTYNLSEIEKPLYEAKFLTKGSFWKVLIALLIPIPILLVARIPFLLIFGFSLPLERRRAIGYQSSILAYRFFTSIPTLILGSLGVCLLTPVFTKQFLKNELSKGKL